MSSVHNSIETVNAAATAIITAETRVQPITVQKKRWGSCWSIYWCFGSYKQRKRIGHAILAPEPTVPGITTPATENLNHLTAIVLPFIAPPSSPASFLQSDPPSASQSPAGMLSLSFRAYSSGDTAPIFTVGPYAHETQLVSPPVLSTFTTEPSTAAFTPPPEPVQMTKPSSLDVSFAQLLASSLARGRMNSRTNQKFSLSQYEFLPYQPYTGSPGGQLISPGSAISNSGTSSPFPDKPPIEFRMGEASKFLGYEHFTNRKWGSRLGSGSLTPNGWGSRLGSGSLTPNGRGSRLGSGTLTPNGGEPTLQGSFLIETQITELPSLANSDHGSRDQEIVIDHRVSFELTGDDLPNCLENVPIPSCETVSASLQDIVAKGTTKNDVILSRAESCNDYCVGEALNEMPGNALEGEGEDFHRKHRRITLGSSKDFDFDNTKEEVLGKSTIGTEWWADKKTVGTELVPQNNWTFFPMLQPGVG